MTVFVAWTPELPEEKLPGPWTELRVAAPGLLLVESDETLSRVFHELKGHCPRKRRCSSHRWPRPRSCVGWPPAP